MVVPRWVVRPLVRVARSVVALLVRVAPSRVMARVIGFLGEAKCLGRRSLVLWWRAVPFLCRVVRVLWVVVVWLRVLWLVVLVVRPVVAIRVRAGVARGSVVPVGRRISL